MARGELRAFLEGIARKTPIRANRVLALVRAAFRWGLREELIERDPTAGLQRPRPERQRERVLGDAEVKRLWEAMDALAAGETDPVLENGKQVPRLVVAGAVKFLLLLGTRRSDTLNMRWADVDERAQTWTVPGKFRKGGRTHVVPLPQLALRILDDLRPISGGKEWARGVETPRRLTVPLKIRVRKKLPSHRVSVSLPGELYAKLELYQGLLGEVSAPTT